MNVLIAIDSFKGSLTSTQAGEAAADGIRRVFPDAHTTVRPLADGGEGTVDALVAGLDGTRRTVCVSDPLGRPVSASYGILPHGVAVLEMAAAAGLPLLSAQERDPMRTTTYGVGQMICDALEQGCRTFLMGLGGSATNDGGTGMLRALGWRFLDADGQDIPQGAAGLAALRRIDESGVHPALRECRFRIACDVNNPLCGECGCSAVYGPQKGAQPQDIPYMDGLLRGYAALTRTCRPAADPEAPGAGAAGGMGFATLAYLDAQLTPGVELVLEMTDTERYIAQADIVVTGEGRLDAQTAMGKAPAGIAALAKRHGKPVIAFSGCLGDGVRTCNAHGIDAYFPILPTCMTVEQAMETARAAAHLTDTAEQAFRLIAAFMR